MGKDFCRTSRPLLCVSAPQWVKEKLVAGRQLGAQNVLAVTTPQL